MPSSRFANRFARCACCSSLRVLTFSDDDFGGAECDGGGGDAAGPLPRFVLGPPFAYVPCKLNEGPALCGAGDAVRELCGE